MKAVAKKLRCAMCQGHKGIPVGRISREYLHSMQRPFRIGGILCRVRIHFPKDELLCRKCRKDVVIRAFHGYGVTTT